MKTELSNALKRISLALNDLSDDDIKKLLDDSYSVEIRLIRKRHKDELPHINSDIDIPNVASEITSLVSREQAQKFLDENFNSRKRLEQIARYLNIPILKNDKVETLRDKIIEATVGAKLRSQAIQGNLI
jgi:hypothetical protein